MTALLELSRRISFLNRFNQKIDAISVHIFHDPLSIRETSLTPCLVSLTVCSLSNHLSQISNYQTPSPQLISQELFVMSSELSLYPHFLEGIRTFSEIIFLNVE